MPQGKYLDKNFVTTPGSIEMLF